MRCTASLFGLRAMFVCTLLASLAQAANSELDQAIEAHRQGTLQIQAAPGVDVRVEQVRHEFWFGAAISNNPFSWTAGTNDAARYKEVFLQNFNSAVTENALKWHSMEPKQGSVDYRVVDAILEWTDKNDIPLRGHNIYWGVTNFVQQWQQEMSDEQLLQVLRDRGITIGTRYRGRFAEYDLNNEMLHDNYYEKRLGPEITRQMASWVRQGDPDAVLYLNDYDILTGARLDDYIAHIKNLLDQGVPIGGIGVQGHLHAETFDPDTLQRSLRALAQFKLPIRITEFNMPGQRSRYMRDRRVQMTPEQEEAKAKALVDYYRICFAEPAVTGILMWGFWEGANWIPASSLYKRDWTPTPAAHAYRDLVFKQWWTDTSASTDAQGRCEVRAFYGKYRVTIGEQEKLVELKRAEGSARVVFP